MPHCTKFGSGESGVKYTNKDEWHEHKIEHMNYMICT